MPQRLKPSSATAQWLMLLALLLAIGGAIALMLYQERIHAETSERDRLESKAKIVEENLEYQLEAIHQTLGRLVLDRKSWGKASDQHKYSRQLQTLSDAMLWARTLAILDAKGSIIASNRTPLIGQNFVGRAYFQIARQGGDPAMLYISPPFSTVYGTLAIAMARVIVDTQGKFDGVVVVTLEPKYFATLLNSVRSQPDMLLTLAQADGHRILSVPPQEDLGGLAVPGSFFSSHIESGRNENVMTGIAPPSTDAQVMALRTVKPTALAMSMPLVVAASRSSALILSEWRRQAYIQGGLFGILAMAGTFGLIFYQKRQRGYEHMLAGKESKRRQAEEALREHAQLLADSQAVAHVGSWYMDAETGNTTVSEETCRIFGRASIPPFPDQVETLYTRETWTQLKDAVEAALQAGHSFDLEVPALSGDGSPLWIHVRCNPYRDEQGGIVGLRGTVQSITERKGREVELLSLREEMRHILEWQIARHTLAALAHEVNQPLSSISALCEAAHLLLQCADAAKIDRLEQLMQRMAAESERAGGMVRQLLASLHRPNTIAESADLATILEEAVYLSRANEFAASQVSIDCAENLRPVWVDRTQLEKLLMNLLVNGFEAMRDAGKVSGRIWISAAAVGDGSKAKITILDEGPGISKEMAAQMFHPFVTTKSYGLGMGLAISRALAEEQGGELWHEAHDGRGATFCFTVPFSVDGCP